LIIAVTIRLVGRERGLGLPVSDSELSFRPAIGKRIRNPQIPPTRPRLSRRLELFVEVPIAPFKEGRIPRVVKAIRRKTV
jgi:hypothetical protein